MASIQVAPSLGRHLEDGDYLCAFSGLDLHDIVVGSGQLMMWKFGVVSCLAQCWWCAVQSRGTLIVVSLWRVRVVSPWSRRGITELELPRKGLGGHDDGCLVVFD